MSIDKITNNRFSESKKMDESDKTSLIKECQTFDQLYDVLEKIGSVEGSKSNYEPHELINIIDKVRKGELTLEYITRTYGLREAVGNLLLDNETPSPKKPPEFKAAVALELPRLESTQQKNEVFNNPNPDVPPEINTAVALDIPSGEYLDKVNIKSEDAPDSPISPLTEEELDFYLRADAEDNQRYSGTYESNLYTAPGDYLNINKPEVESRYKSLKQKYDRYESILRPNSFEALTLNLQNSSIQIENESINGQELLQAIDKVKKGEMLLSQLPASLRNGIASLVAKNIFVRLKNEPSVEIRDHEWDMIMQTHPPKADYLGNRNSIGYPKIGDNNIRFKNSTIEGTLVWANSSIVLIKTALGFQAFPSDTVLMDNNKTSTQNNDEDTLKRNIKKRSLKQRPLPR